MLTRDALLASAWYWVSLASLALLFLYAIISFLYESRGERHPDPTLPPPLRALWRAWRWLLSPITPRRPKRPTAAKALRAFSGMNLDVSGYWVTADRRSERHWRYLPGGADLLGDSTCRPQEREAEEERR